jgi:hypothetical protein
MSRSIKEHNMSGRTEFLREGEREKREILHNLINSDNKVSSRLGRRFFQVCVCHRYRCE